MNPAVTLTFLRLGKARGWDAVFFIAARTFGGTVGVLIVAALFGSAFTDAPVNYAATMPGSGGPWIAFIAELLISGALMFVILTLSGTARLARFTGYAAGCLVALYITFESPLSGMSMNPARTFGSAVFPQLWDSLWIYFLAPPLGMFAAAAVYLRLMRVVGCAKLHHQNKLCCIFCEYQAALRKEIQLHKPGELSLPLA